MSEESKQGGRERGRQVSRSQISGQPMITVKKFIVSDPRATGSLWNMLSSEGWALICNLNIYLFT